MGGLGKKTHAARARARLDSARPGSEAGTEEAGSKCSGGMALNNNTVTTLISGAPSAKEQNSDISPLARQPAARVVVLGADL
jgi:hypothetical protein